MQAVSAHKSKQVHDWHVIESDDVLPWDINAQHCGAIVLLFAVRHATFSME